MVNKALPMQTPPNLLPFISSLRKEADSFANLVTNLSLVGALIWGGWWIVGLLGHGAPPAGVTRVFICISAYYLVFRGLAALIDYTIAAVFQAFSEFVGGYCTLVAQSAERASDDDDAPGVHPQRDSAVAYLHDFLKHPRQAHNDDAGPADPKPAA